MNDAPDRSARRGVLAALAGTAVAAALPVRVLAQASQGPHVDPSDPVAGGFTRGAPVSPGRVRLELPVLADNGNSVPLKITVQSPMTETDHVKAIQLISERNPVRDMAVFRLGPRAGRAEIASRVRLAGSQRVVAIAEMSDGSFWSDAAEIVVTLSACVDES